jgi:hypothetical protein
VKAIQCNLEVGQHVRNALRVTTAVEALDVLLGQSESMWRTPMLLDAINDNVGLRTIVVNASCRHDACSFTKGFWSSVLRSRTLTTIDAAALASAIRLNDADRREVSLHVVDLLKSNRVVTDLRYYPDTHDADIMWAKALPLLQLNRLRSAATDLGRIVPAALKWVPARRSPMLRYYLLRGAVATLVRHRRTASRALSGDSDASSSS